MSVKRIVLGVSGASGAPIAMRIAERLAGRDVVFEHVKGHSGHPLNEVVDSLARAQATALKDAAS